MKTRNTILNDAADAARASRYSNATVDARLVLNMWMDHPGAASPHDLLENDEWRELFYRVGPHHVYMYGEMADVHARRGRAVMMPTLVETAYQRKSLTAPDHLYRVAHPGGENRWNWFEDFATAQLVIDDVGGGLKIWACEPGEVFAAITFDRVEPGGYRRQWTEWVVEPTNVREIDRHRDPFTPVANLEKWEKRGVHAIEAGSVVGNWFRSTTGMVAPMDKEGAGYWLSQFQQMGQFEAVSKWDAADQSTPQKMHVEPASELVAPKYLYRGSTEALRGRWSWTEEVETAQAFIDLFCPDDGKIWVAEAATVFGVIRAKIANPRPPFERDFTEWIVFPNEDTIHEYVPTDAHNAS